MLKKFFKSVLPSMAAFTFSSLLYRRRIFCRKKCRRRRPCRRLHRLPAHRPYAGARNRNTNRAARSRLPLPGEKKKKKTAFSFSWKYATLFAASIGVTALLLSPQPLLALMGAETVTQPCRRLCGIMLAGAGFQIFATGCVPLLRNYDAPVLAMMSMIAGFSTNIVLDWLFVSRLYSV